MWRVLELPRGRFLLISKARTSKDLEEIIEALRDLEENEGISSQILDQDLVPGERFLIEAVILAIRSFELGKNATSRLSMEILVRAAAHREIRVAIDRIGVRDPSKGFFLIMVGSSREEIVKALEKIAEDLDLELLPLEYSPDLERILGIFDISREEVEIARREGERIEETIEKLAIERIVVSWLER